MRAERSAIGLVSALALALIANACGDDTSGPGDLIVVIRPDTATMDIADTLDLSATVTDASGDPVDREVTWSSQNPEVARVSPTGQVTAGAEGIATIRASVNGASADAAITVVRFPAASLTVEPSVVETEPARPLELTATLRSEEGRELGGRSIVWSSDDVGVATVSETGLLDPVARGTASVTARHQSLEGSVAVTVLFQIETLGTGTAHTCGLTDQSSIYCWGDNTTGELGLGLDTGPENCGDPTTEPPIDLPCSLTPLPIASGLDFTEIRLGGNHSCALTPEGELSCWGANESGQLGDGSTQGRNQPVAVAGDLTFESFALGALHTCGILQDGPAQCWGENGLGTLGDGTTENRSLPTPVAGNLDFVSLAAGADVSCGLTADGNAHCWGSNTRGQLGSGPFVGPETCEVGGNDLPCSRTPVPVSGGIEFSSIAAGGSHVCGLDDTGTAHCWGANASGALGDGTMTDRAAPVAVTGGLTFRTIVVGGVHTCGLATDDRVYCWGANGAGQLGVSPSNPQTTPIQISGNLTFTDIVTGGQGAHTCGLAEDGNAYCWGQNSNGQLGDGTDQVRSEPTRVFRQ